MSWGADENRVGRNKSQERQRRSRLALMVSDIVRWLGLAQASKLMKYLHGLQNERLIHFISAGAVRGGEKAGPLFHLFTY